MVDRIRAGDDSALGAVYDRYGAVVHGVALQLLDADQADDVTQDVFVHLWQHPEGYDPTRGGLRSFLAIIARRRAIDALRSAQRRDAREHRAAAPGADEHGVEDAALASIRSGEVRSALVRLPPEQRRAIELAYFGGLTFRDVARVMNTAEGTAKSRLRLGLGHLARDLAPQQDAAGELAWT